MLWVEEKGSQIFAGDFLEAVLKVKDQEEQGLPAGTLIGHLGLMAVPFTESDNHGKSLV